MSANLHDLIKSSLSAREDLITSLHAEHTDCYRLFHGTAEGWPGLTVDRYGEQLLVQTFHTPLSDEQVRAIARLAGEHFHAEFVCVYHDRSSAEARRAVGGPEEGVRTCRELGVTYAVRDRHRGQDPLLFLDLRTARRWLLAHSRGRSVLNLFAYTCGAGICAACGGAAEVWNVDFASSSLGYGEENARLNDISEDRVRFVHEDCLPVMRQLAGLSIKGRGSRRPHLKLAARQFDLVFLDPPRWVKSPFGAVDLVRDYQSLFKPALLATADGGTLVCTNHVPSVSETEWLDVLSRCAGKAGRELKNVELLVPEGDFPSFDQHHPLKIAVCSL